MTSPLNDAACMHTWKRECAHTAAGVPLTTLTWFVFSLLLGERSYGHDMLSTISCWASFSKFTPDVFLKMERQQADNSREDAGHFRGRVYIGSSWEGGSYSYYDIHPAHTRDPYYDSLGVIWIIALLSYCYQESSERPYLLTILYSSCRRFTTCSPRWTLVATNCGKQCYAFLFILPQLHSTIKNNNCYHNLHSFLLEFYEHFCM
jgi:hypothetical protein